MWKCFFRRALSYFFVDEVVHRDNENIFGCFTCEEWIFALVFWLFWKHQYNEGYERPACLFSSVEDILLTVIKWSVWLGDGETINTCRYDHITIVFHISNSISTLYKKKHPKSQLYFGKKHPQKHTFQHTFQSNCTHTHAMQNMFGYTIPLK